jgi:transposase
MISTELEAHILRLFHAERWPAGTIAREVGVHHSTVRRVLAQAGQDPVMLVRPSMADPYMPFIRAQLEKYPKLHASRLYHMVKDRGYPGSEAHFRSIVARLRPKRYAEAYLRMRTLPGEQAQVDWACFPPVTIGKAKRQVYAFVMVLSWSRAIFLRFYLGHAHTSFFLRGHQDAFDFFEGVPRELLYDNLKSAVLERRADAIRFNPRLLEFAAHYRFMPKPVNVARGNEKGRVERGIRYIRDSFFAGREWEDLDGLNAQALEWCRGIAQDRPCPEDRSMTVREALEQERLKLLDLPENPFPTDERVEATVGKTPYARFDLNDYTVPHTHAGKRVTVLAGPTVVRILDGTSEIARHARCYDRGRQIEEVAHVQELVEHKQQAREGRNMDRLLHAVPSSRELFERLAERGGNLGGTTFKLLKLLDAFGAQELEIAVAEAVKAGAPGLGAIQQILDQRRHAATLPPPVSQPLPEKARNLTRPVKPQSLQDWSALTPKREGGQE